MRCLDEATMAVVTAEMTDVDASCTACCCLILACEKARDIDRAAQWCAKLEDRARRSSHRLMFAVCRAHYAGVLIWRGAWAEAEAVLEEAISELDGTHRATAAEALVMLAELRRRQGRLDEAGALFERAAAQPFRMLTHNTCLLGRADMALDLDDAEAALDLAGRFLRVIPADDRLERAAGLELLVRAHAARGATENAEEALRELRTLAVLVSTRPMQAVVRFSEGLLATDPTAAKPCFEDAVELWTRSGAPFEAARARIELCRTLLRLGRRGAAIEEARAADQALCAIGAMQTASRARALVQELERADPAACEAGPSSLLSSRELEVLRLVAQGLTNKQIASQLCRSEHTVHRHVANILPKLTLPARSAAVSYAAKHNLL
jgi:ATP/maltotriose-dependent transcriptional regulator MalT